jgi:hypothetical protein
MHTLISDNTRYWVDGREVSYEEYTAARLRNEEEELRQQDAQDDGVMPPQRPDLEHLDSDD